MSVCCQNSECVRCQRMKVYAPEIKNSKSIERSLSIKQTVIEVGDGCIYSIYAWKIFDRSFLRFDLAQIPSTVVQDRIFC